MCVVITHTCLPSYCTSVMNKLLQNYYSTSTSVVIMHLHMALLAAGMYIARGFQMHILDALSIFPVGLVMCIYAVECCKGEFQSSSLLYAGEKG